MLELLSFVVFSGIKWTCKKVIVIFKYSLYQYLLIFLKIKVSYLIIN